MDLAGPRGRTVSLAAPALGRRVFLAGAAAALAGDGLLSPDHALAAPGLSADFSLEIGPVALELAPGHIVNTIGYNGSVPGPMMRVREGQTVSVAVHNLSEASDLVHWHGLRVPAEIDGAMEEGSPMIEPGGTFHLSIYRSACRHTVVSLPRIRRA